MAELFPSRSRRGRQGTVERVSLTRRFVKAARRAAAGAERKPMNNQAECGLVDIKGQLARKLLRHFFSGIRRIRPTSGLRRSRPAPDALGNPNDGKRSLNSLISNAEAGADLDACLCPAIDAAGAVNGAIKELDSALISGAILMSNEFSIDSD